MASAKQIKAQKLFAKRSKRGDFRKAITKTKKAKSKETNAQRSDQVLHRLGIMDGSRELAKIEALEEVTHIGQTKITWIPDEVMVKATEEGFQVPSGWYKLTRKQKLGFLKKFWRTK